MKSYIYLFLGWIIKKMLPLSTCLKRVVKETGKRQLTGEGKKECIKLNNTLKECICDLSLIVPVYNSEKYLKKCLDSLLNQKTSYQYEIIAVNDGSTDRSLEILEQYKTQNKKIHLITQSNQGISAARNIGVENANGRYIGFVDNDDFVTENYCEVLLKKAYEKNADIVKCGHFRYDVANDRVATEITSPQTSISGEIGDAIVEYKGFIWSGIYKKSLFEDIRFPLGYWYEDMIGRILLMRKSQQFEFITDSLYYYCLHQCNASKTVWKQNSLKALDQLFLAKNLADYGEQIGLGRENGLYKILLLELGPVLWLRCGTLGKKLLRETFFDAAEYMDGFKMNTASSLVGEQKYLAQAFVEKNYIQWWMASLAYMCTVKGTNVKG